MHHTRDNLVRRRTDHVDELYHSHAEFDVHRACQIFHRTNERVVGMLGEQILHEPHLIRTAQT